jgi:hypothetical protein
MDRRRSRSPKRSHRRRSSSSERGHRYSDRSRDRDRYRERDRYRDSYKERERTREKRPQRQKSSSSPSPPRYKFDSPPKTFIEYNKKIWKEYESATNPEEFINKIQQVASTIPSSQANKIDRELYIGNLPSGMTGPQLVELLNRTLIKIEANICVRVM